MSSPGLKSLASTSSESLSSEEKKISRREEVSRNREKLQREKEGNLTFQPTTLKKSASAVSLEESNESRFDKLYGEAKKRKDTGRKAVDNFSFKPTITSKGKKRSSTPEGTSKRLYDAPGAGKPRRSNSVDKSKDRSFSPQITSRGRSIERGSGDLSSPSTRLYSQAQTQKENRQALASKISKEASKELTFAPKTNNETKTPSVPLEERMGKYLVAREKRMADLKEKQDAQESQSATFKPTSFTKGRSPSSERSRRGTGADTAYPIREPTVVRPARDENAPATVFDRLASAGLQKSKKKPVVHVDKEEKELTFKPNLVSKRCASPQRQEEASKYGNVHNRLYQKGNEQRMEGKAKKAELRKQMEKEHTFAPTVSSTLRPNPNPDSPTKGAVFERLSASRQYVHEILSQVKTEFELENCTFRPEINKTAESVSQKNAEPAYMRLSAEAHRFREENEKRQAKKQEDELIDCTFSPAIDKKSTKVITSKRKDMKETVFDRLSTGPNGPISPPIQENHPVNVPKVIRRSTIEKLAKSKGVIAESGSPKKEQANGQSQSSFMEAVEMESDALTEQDEQQQEQQEQQQQEEGEGPADKLVPISPVTIPSAKEQQEIAEEFFQDQSEF